jgi:hypothetical protein
MNTNDETAQEAVNKKRFFVIQEIISTELTYTERLRIALENIVNPLRELRLIDSSDLQEQFGSLQSVYDLHKKHSVIGSTSCNLKFLSLFEDICSRLDVYSSYLVHYEPAMQRRATLLTSNRRFADFVDKVHKDPALQGQNIESLLILPVQRIPRYRLLLEQLLKYTSEGHPDYVVIESSLAKICDLAHYNNEAIRKRENNNKLMSIMMQIQSSERPNLLDTHNERRFLKEGVLQKQCRLGLFFVCAFPKCALWSSLMFISQETIQKLPVLAIVGFVNVRRVNPFGILCFESHSTAPRVPGHKLARERSGSHFRVRGKISPEVFQSASNVGLQFVLVLVVLRQRS